MYVLRIDVCRFFFYSSHGLWSLRVQGRSWGLSIIMLPSRHHHNHCKPTHHISYLVPRVVCCRPAHTSCILSSRRFLFWEPYSLTSACPKPTCYISFPLGYVVWHPWKSTNANLPTTSNLWSSLRFAQF
jgi:hypothetical protein